MTRTSLSPTRLFPKPTHKYSSPTNTHIFPLSPSPPNFSLYCPFLGFCASLTSTHIYRQRGRKKRTRILLLILTLYRGRKMDGGGCGVVGGGATNCRQRSGNRRRSDKPYKGIRMRKWGKWVAEIREPNKRSRIWLGSYSTPVAAARAYDTAVYYLRGPSAKLNFPEEISISGGGAALKDLSAASIRKKAAEVGARVDALQANTFGPGSEFGQPDEEGKQSLKPSWFQEVVDLNKKPEPEDQSSGL